MSSEPFLATVEMNARGIDLADPAFRCSDRPKYRLPAESNTMPAGVFNWAAEASPPSPLKFATPVPANVVMTPVVLSILRIAWLPPHRRV